MRTFLNNTILNDEITEKDGINLKLKMMITQTFVQMKTKNTLPSDFEF